MISPQKGLLNQTCLEHTYTNRKREIQIRIAIQYHHVSRILGGSSQLWLPTYSPTVGCWVNSSSWPPQAREQLARSHSQAGSSTTLKTSLLSFFFFLIVCPFNDSPIICIFHSDQDFANSFLFQRRLSIYNNNNDDGDVENISVVPCINTTWYIKVTMAAICRCCVRRKYNFCSAVINIFIYHSN